MDTLYEKLIENSESDVYPFHMPGHKRRLLPEFDRLPFDLDVTEVEGFDNLYHATGVLREMEEHAAWYFKCKRAFVLVNGATGGILSAVRALTKPGDRVLLARNCHRSVYNAAELCALRPSYIIPETAEEDGRPLNIYGAVPPQEVERKLIEHPDTMLVVITSPTYDGIPSDICAIADICHTHGAKLLVDEAHGGDCISAGACYGLPRVYFPDTSIRCGADVSVVSLHKSFPALTQTALLLTTQPSLIEPLQNQLAVFQTSSPSYVLMASADACIKTLAATRTPFWNHCVRLEDFCEKAAQLKHLRVLFNGKEYHHMSSRILISTTVCQLSGYELAAVLRGQYHLETEMATPDYVLALTTICDTDEGVERLLNALFEIDRTCQSAQKNSPEYLLKTVPQQAFIPCEKYKYKADRILLDKAQGRIAMETVMAYPPGIPCVVPGEVINDEILAHIRTIQEAGGSVYFDSQRQNGKQSIMVAD